MKIEIEIEKDGQARVDVNGIKGGACLKETDWLEKALGKVEKRTFKKEYYEKETVRQKN